jgi:putative heme-binding domain-containing protein
LSSLLDALDRKNVPLTSLANEGRMFSPLFDWATELAASETKDAQREPAIRLLARNPERQADDLKLLASLLDRPNSGRLQTAVLDAFKRVRSAEVPALLLNGWQLRPPALRQSCIEVMFSREEWLKDLLAALENNTVGPNEISPADRQRLLKHKDQAIQQRAAAVFKPSDSSRAEVLKKYQAVALMSGDAVHGAEIFGKTCATCHALRGQGHSVGPNLAALTDKTPADFLLAILDPSAVVEPRFVAYNIETKDGRSLSGVVSAETGTTLTLVQSGGLQEKILRSDIAEMRASKLSMMPEGLEQGMSQQDLADLIAFLKSGPAPFGSATPERAEAARKKLLEGGMNGVSKILSAAEQLPYPSWVGELPMAHCRQTDGKSKLLWETAATPASLKPEAMHEFRLPAAMGYVSNPPGKFSLRLNGKAVLDFGVVLGDQTWHSADGKVEMRYSVMENNNEDSNGMLLIRVPGALLEPGKPATFEVVGSAADSMRWFGIYIMPKASAQAVR